MLEKDIQREILNYLLFNGFFVWRQNSGVITRGGHMYSAGIKGQPDIVGMTKDGRWLGIEVKNVKGIQNFNQKQFEQNVLDSKGIYILARSLDDVLEAFKLHKIEVSPTLSGEVS
jgi:hypothetical protein